MIDWGTGGWYHSGPWGAFSTKSVSFDGAGVTLRAFGFLTPRRLVSLRAYNGGPGATTVTVRCAGQADAVAGVAPAQVATLVTGWTAGCTSVTVGSSNGWHTNFDDLVHDDPAPDPTAPVISGVVATAQGATGATVSWTTDEAATSQVEYGPTAAYGAQTALDGALVTQHGQTLLGLTPDTAYHFRVLSRDGAGNEARSPDGGFRTGPASATGATEGEWSAVLSWPLVAVHATLLQTGEVLLWDGWELPTSQARVWHPGGGAFASVPVGSGLFCAGHAALADGRILVAGGHTRERTPGSRTPPIFDPARRTWTRVADMHLARWYPSATTLPDGRVLVVSGQISSGVWADTPEVYDPATNAWTLLTGVDTSDLHDPEYPLAYLLPDGRVLLYGATGGQTRVLDVQARSWTNAGMAPIASGSAAMVRPGQLLVSGGGIRGQQGRRRRGRPCWRPAPARRSGGRRRRWPSSAPTTTWCSCRTGRPWRWGARPC